MSKLLFAAIELTLKRCSSGMGTHVVLQVLLQCKSLIAKFADVFLPSVMYGLVTPHTILVFVNLVARAVNARVHLFSLRVEVTFF